MEQYYNSKNGQIWKNNNNTNKRIDKLFYTANRELTSYSFNCGYLERFEVVNPQTGTTDNQRYEYIEIEKINPSTLCVHYCFRDYIIYPTQKMDKYFYTEKRAEAYKKLYAIIKNNNFTDMEN